MSNSLLKYINNKGLGSGIDDVQEFTSNISDSQVSLMPGSRAFIDGVMVEGTIDGRVIRAEKPGKLHLIGGRNVFSDSRIAIGAEARCYQMWRPFDSKVKMKNIRIITANTWMNGVDQGLGNAFTFEASIFRPNDTVPTIVRFNSSTSISVSENTYVMSDPVPMILDPATDGVNGLYLRLRIRTTNLTDFVPYADQKMLHVSSGTDCYRLTGTASATSTFCSDLSFDTTGKTIDINEFGPVFIVGETVTGEIVPSVGVWGSSSATGYGDAQASASNIQKVLGYLAHSLTREKIPYVVFAQGGATVKSDGLNDSYTRKQLASLLNLTHGVNTYGSNDVTYGDSPATILSNLKAFNEQLKGLGMTYTAFCTYTPVVTASDGYTTVTGQTVTNPDVRKNLSQLVRDNSHLWYVIDLEKYSDSNLVAGISAPSQKWTIEYGTPYSSDGQHGSPSVIQGISNKINWSSFVKF